MENTYDLKNDEHSFILVYGPDNVSCSGGPNIHLCEQQLHILPQIKSTEESKLLIGDLDRKLLTGYMARHSHTDFSIVEIKKILNGDIITYNLTQQLAYKYQYLTKIFIKCKNMIPCIIFNIGGAVFDFTEEHFNNYDFYKNKIITKFEQFIIIEIPVPMLSNNGVLPIHKDLQCSITTYSDNIDLLECTVIQTDREETRRVEHCFTELPFQNVDKYFRYPKKSKFINHKFIPIELCEYTNASQKETILATSCPIKEIFIGYNEKQTNANSTLSLSCYLEKNTFIKTKQYTHDETCILLQLVNYKKYNLKYGYIPLTHMPNTLQHTGEITCAGHKITITANNPDHILTYGNALFVIYYDLDTKQIMCEITDSKTYYDYSRVYTQFNRGISDSDSD